MILREIIINSVAMFVFLYTVNFTIFAILNDHKEHEDENVNMEELNMNIVDEHGDEHGDEEDHEEEENG